jgi:putative transposase
MAAFSDHRKRVKHFHEPGDLHELTFSCYDRRPLLDDDWRREQFCRSIDAAMISQNFRLVAFVLMPEHLHLLVYPLNHKPENVRIDNLLSALKRPFSYRVKVRLQELKDPLLERLTIQERPGKMTFRFWQEGPGYDRNLRGEKTVLHAIDYIHRNPVRRGLVLTAAEWKWSSARWYFTDKQIVDPDLPTIHGLPPDFFV